MNVYDPHSKGSQKRNTFLIKFSAVWQMTSIDMSIFRCVQQYTLAIEETDIVDTKNKKNKNNPPIIVNEIPT